MRVLLVAVLVLAAGCSGDPEPASRAPVSEAAQPSEPTPTGTARPTARDIVEDPDAYLYALDVTRSGKSFGVTSMWSLDRQRGQRDALAKSDDGFRTGRYVTGGNLQLQKAIQQPRPAGAGKYETCSQVVGGVDLCFDYDRTRVAWTQDGGLTWSDAAVDLGRLLPGPSESLARDVFAVVGGSDGATLFPFERVVRSVDGGATWERFDLPLFRGERAYSSGEVVTSDGRLVALLDHFSDDRTNRPGDRLHGLWSSAGADWSSYRPLLSRMTPPRTPSPDAWPAIVALGASSSPDPVIWAKTWDHRLYVSTDDARTFREIPAR